MSEAGIVVVGAVVNVDEVLRAVIGPEHAGRLREVADAVLRDLTVEACEALCGAFALDGRDGASTFLASRLTRHRLFVRIRDVTKRVRHVLGGYSFDRWRWYSVPEEMGERLRNEAASDQGAFQALFQVESYAPVNQGGKVERIVFLL